MANENMETTEYINLSEVYVRSIIGYMMKNTLFFRQCVVNLTPANIPYPKVSMLFKLTTEFYKTYNKFPTKEDVLMLLHQKYPTATDYTTHQAELDQCMMATDRVTFESLSTQMSGWLRFLALAKVLKTAGLHFNSKAYADSEKVIEDGLTKIRGISFEKDDRVRFESIADDLNAFVLDKKNCCTLGNSDFDEMLLKGSRNSHNSQQNIKEATGGSLMPGDLTVFLGPSNAGKTTTVATIIASNLLFGKKILFITHEERKEKIKIKLIQSFLGLSAEALSSYDPQTLKMYSDAFVNQAKDLHYYEWIKAGKMNVEEVTDFIQQLQDKEISKTGKGFDLVVDDYPGKLKSKAISFKNGYEEQAHVYDCFLTLGRINKFHVLVPAQTNRAGYRIGRDGSDSKEARMLDQGDVNGGFGIMQIADNVITINRSKNDIGTKIIKYHIAKSRSGETGWTFISKTSFEKSRSFFQDLPSIAMGPSDKWTDEEMHKRLGLVYNGLSSAEASGNDHDFPVEVGDNEHKEQVSLSVINSKPQTAEEALKAMLTKK